MSTPTFEFGMAIGCILGTTICHIVIDLRKPNREDMMMGFLNHCSGTGRSVLDARVFEVIFHWSVRIGGVMGVVCHQQHLEDK